MPPVLRIGHQLEQILLQRKVVELLEGLGVVEVLVQRIGFGGMLVQEIQAQLIRPPVAARRAAAGGVIERALDLVGHCIVSHGPSSIVSREAAFPTQTRPRWRHHVQRVLPPDPELSIRAPSRAAIRPGPRARSSARHPPGPGVSPPYYALPPIPRPRHR